MSKRKFTSVESIEFGGQQLLAGDVGATVALEELLEGCDQAAEQRAKGRPKGSRNHQVDTVDAPPTACKKCGSTRRTPYTNKRELPIRGVCIVTRQPYTSIVLRRTSCVDCGQYRDDRTLINQSLRPGKK